MKKYILDFKLTENKALHDAYVLLKLTPADGALLPPMLPGQFVNILIPDSPKTYLRRPISVHNVDMEQNELWLLVRKAGEGTKHLAAMPAGSIVNMVVPLGNTFSYPSHKHASPLLVGGGVGVAPLLYWGKELLKQGYAPQFLLGARSKKDLLQLEEFAAIGNVHIATDDGSCGEKGVVTQHSVWNDDFSFIYACGPKPMMVAVASKARSKQTPCEVSLENMMACGVGACLCCVEKSTSGHVCVCKEGPIFNIELLTWQI